MTDIDRTAMDSMSVAPGEDDMPEATDPRQEAGQDKSIAERLARNPDSEDARLDNGLDESMDASDPISIIQPSDRGEPAPSSGYQEDGEGEH